MSSGGHGTGLYSCTFRNTGNGCYCFRGKRLNFVKITFQGVLQLKCVLMRESKDDIRAAAAWSLGQIGRHTPEHAKAVAQADVLPELLKYYIDRESSEDLKLKV